MHFNRISELPTLETERLILRPFRMEDVHPWYVMHLDPAITKYTGDGGVVSEEEIERRIREHVLGDYEKHGFGRWAVDFKENGELIGFAGLKFMPDVGVVDIGYRFKQEYWGKGIATESCLPCIDFGFNTLDLEEIYGYILPENTASARVLEKLHFQFKRAFMYEGELEHEFILKREEYQKELA